MNYIPSKERYDTMIYKRCGNSGLMLPILSLGFWHNFGTNDDYENMKRLCFTAFDNGITHFDLANNYGPMPGSAESNLGRILKEEMKAWRDELIISSKAGYHMWDGPYGDFGSRKYLISSLDQSLLRLGLDYVDIFYHHRMDPDTPLEETVDALCHIVNSGKALYIGISNYDGLHMQKVAELLKDRHCPFIINQNSYSIFNRTIEQNGLLEAANENEKGIIAYCPLDQGMLTDRYLNGIPNDSRVKTSGVFLNESNLTEDKLEKIKKLNDMAISRGQSLAQMALSWVTKNQTVTSALIGASKSEQILDNLKILMSEPLSDEELKKIDEIVF